MVVVMKKDQIWKKRRYISRKIQRGNINHFRRYQQSDQGYTQQVGGLIASSQI